MMKETSKSLKGYFILVGTFGALSGLMTLIASEGIINKIAAIAFFVMAIMFIYYGVKIDYFLKTSPKTLKIFLVTVIAINVALRLLSLQLAYAAVAVLLGWYLIHSVTKLSAPAKLSSK